MTPTPEEIEATAGAEEQLRKQQDAGAGPFDLTGLDVLSTVSDLALSAAQGAGELAVSAASGAVEVVGGVLGAIGSVFDGL